MLSFVFLVIGGLLGGFATTRILRRKEKFRNDVILQLKEINTELEQLNNKTEKIYNNMDYFN